MSIKNIQLVLFFTKGVSLKTWVENGSLSREIALYLRLQEKGVRVSFVTYGQKTDLEYRDQVQGIEILCNHWQLGSRTYAQLIPLLHARALSRATLIKTNQIKGAEVARRAAWFWRKPYVARCGYVLSEWAELNGILQDLEQARSTEQRAFESARRVVVTTSESRSHVMKQYGLSPERVWVIPNYVMTDLFKPGLQPPVPNRICFVGRLVEQKNLHALIQACAGLQVELHIIGTGHLKESLQETANQSNVHLFFHGNLPHHQLPAMICSSTIFAFVSHYEGHPKALLEAMACGVPVLGADSPGIREQIVHGETGWLCGTDPESIRSGIQCLLRDEQLRTRLANNGRAFIEQNYSLERVAELEYNLLQEVTQGPIR